MRYGVKYQPLSGEIHAGVVRHDMASDRQVFVTKCECTQQAIGAVALWLTHHDEPYQITNRSGVIYELSARVVPVEGNDAMPNMTTQLATGPTADGSNGEN